MLHRRKLVVGNWKMNGSQAANAALIRGLLDGIPSRRQCEVAVCVPFPYLGQVQTLLGGHGVAWGAQDASERDQGAYTGDVSASMIAEFGCRYVIVGHSERRGLHAETSELVAQKAARVLQADMVPIVCVGETLVEREQGRTYAIVEHQLGSVLDALGADASAGMVVAYEPVWAIGTGKTATGDQAQDVHAFLREQLARRGIALADAVRILYGGSVKPANAAELMSMPDIDGGLIGGASLDAADFVSIVAAAGVV